MVRPTDAMGQVGFVEDDPGNYDLNFWLDYFERTHCDAACLSAGGVVAFYPTQIPLHYRSKWLGTTDAFGDIMAGCRKLGMNIVARTDAHACHQEMYEAHPGWIAVGRARQQASASFRSGFFGLPARLDPTTLNS